MKKKIFKKGAKFLVQPIGRYLLKENHRLACQYAGYYERLGINKRVIFYECRDGAGITDNPYAIFKYLLDHPDYQDFIHIWSFSDFAAAGPVIAKYRNRPNVKFVRRNSKSYLKALASSGYLINNATFQSFFSPKPGQIYINTWHGTPLKRMGFDIPGNPAHSQNVVRNFLSADYLLSPNPHTTKMYTDSYKLKGLYGGRILETGYPRIDLTIRTEARKVREELGSLGLKLDPEKKTVLYAPTWKGEDVSHVENDAEKIMEDFFVLVREAGDAYNFLLKVHPYLYGESAKLPALRNRLVPDSFDTNELLAGVDVLVTDYSSIFFDFLVTNKPILFYVPDAERYKEERGCYFKFEELPGPVFSHVRDVVKTLPQIGDLQEQYRERYEAAKQAFVLYEDGNATERIIRFIFHGETGDVKVLDHLNTGKEKILIYPGGLKDNGITSSFINLMNNLDHSRYDVSCFSGYPRSQEVLKNIAKIHPAVRLLFKPGLPLYTLPEVYRDKWIHHFGKRGRLEQKLYPHRAYKREHRRLFGRTAFDYVIDFSGYSLYWAKHLLPAEAKKKICFMHNDLLSESRKTINGKMPHYINLRGLFTVYNDFDKLVSVSKGTMELNRERLSKYAPMEKFYYVMNSIQPERIFKMEEKRPQYQMEMGGEITFIPEKDRYHFVNMDRLSPEKGQDRLIRAFTNVYAKHPVSRLLILGQGPLKEELQSLIDSLGIGDAAFLLGQIEHPFPLLRRCDCFVLSSHYEGQPMVLLEAMTLGMKIIATDIVANRTVLEGGKYGLLVENSINGLEKGMLAVLERGGELASEPFDYRRYNKLAMETFYNCLREG